MWNRIISVYMLRTVVVLEGMAAYYCIIDELLKLRFRCAAAADGDVATKNTTCFQYFS